MGVCCPKGIPSVSPRDASRGAWEDMLAPPCRSLVDCVSACTKPTQAQGRHTILTRTRRARAAAPHVLLWGGGFDSILSHE